MSGIDHDKYRLARNGPAGTRTRLYMQGSFFPLIEGDALAVMTLRSYANNCLQVLDWKVNPITGKPLTEEQRDHITELGMDALDLAEKWAKAPLHLPD